MEPGPNILSIGNTFAQPVIGLILPIQQLEFHLPVSVEGQPDLLDIDRSYHATGGGFWGAFMDGRLVGTIGLINIGNHQGVLRKFFVDKDYRGREKGIAQQLLDALLAHCHSAGITDIYLGTIDTMTAAARFYGRNGFLRIQKNRLPPTFPLMPVDNVFYHLHVAASAGGMKVIDRSGILGIATRLQRLSDQLRRDASQIYETAGIPFEAKWFPVIFVLDAESPLTVMEITGQIGYSHPSTIHLLKELEKAKLVRSTDDKRDSRKRLIHLTPAGRDLIRRMKPIWSRIATALSDLTHTGCPLLQTLDEVEMRLKTESLHDRTMRLP